RISQAEFNESVVSAGKVDAIAAAKPRQTLHALAAQKAADAQAAAARADAARLQSVKKTLENSRISAALHLTESLKSRLEAQVIAAQSAVDAADSPQAVQAAEEAKAKMTRKL